MTDQKLIGLIRGGETQSALGKLYRYFPGVRKMVTANSGTVHDAEDVFQDGLIILLRKVNREDLELSARLSTYLFGICRLLWKDELKKRKNLEWAPADALPEGFGQYEADELLAAESRAKLVETILSNLKDRCRELLLLFYDGRMKLKDIAQKMGYSSEQTAKNQKYKCIEHARNKLKELSAI